MQPKHFCYYKPKVFIATGFLLAVLSGLIVALIRSSHIGVIMVCTILFTFLGGMFIFLVKDGVVPAILNKPVLTVDENGITDIVSWDFIKWSNIQTMEAVKVTSNGRSAHSFTELHIVLKDLGQYEYYNRSRWIRFKVKFLNAYKGVDIVIDIDALNGKATDVFNDINACFKHNKKHKQ